MGYSTDFDGGFTVTPPLTDEDANDLIAFADERHGGNTEAFPGMPGFWCQWVPGKSGSIDNPSAITMEDYQAAFAKLPYDTIEWDGGEKFYDYVEWLEYLINHKLAPKGYVLNGEVEWQGEESSDRGLITVENNKIRLSYAQVTFVPYDS